MSLKQTIEEAKEIIATGCSCDRHDCEKLAGADGYCGCEEDAKKIIALVVRRHGQTREDS